MERIIVERRGGLCGVTTQVELRKSNLKSADRIALQELLGSEPSRRTRAGVDQFWYRIRLVTSAGERTVEIPEDYVPKGIAAAVRARMRDRR